MSQDVELLPAIRRIVVAVDGSAHSLAALDAAAALAARLHAELEALFIEDVDLLGLADLPFAQVTSLTLQSTEHTDRERMERQLRVLAERTQRAVHHHVSSLGVRARFRTVRGEVTAEILAAATEADLLSLGKAGHGRMGGVRTGHALHAALGSGRPLLIVESRPRLGHGLLAVYDGSAGGVRALALAGDLAASSGQPLHVLLLASPPAKEEGLAARAERLLEGRDLQPRFSYSEAEPAVAVAAAVRRLRPGLLVLATGDGVDCGRLLAAVDCPLLLVP